MYGVTMLRIVVTGLVPTAAVIVVSVAQLPPPCASVQSLLATMVTTAPTLMPPGACTVSCKPMFVIGVPVPGPGAGGDATSNGGCAVLGAVLTPPVEDETP